MKGEWVPPSPHFTISVVEVAVKAICQLAMTHAEWIRTPTQSLYTPHCDTVSCYHWQPEGTILSACSPVASILPSCNVCHVVCNVQMLYDYLIFFFFVTIDN